MFNFVNTEFGFILTLYSTGGHKVTSQNEIWLCWKIFHYELNFLLVDFSCLMILHWGVQKIWVKKLYFWPQEPFLRQKRPKIGQNWPKSTFFLKLSKFSWPLNIFQQGFLQKLLWEPPRHPLDYLCTNFHEPWIFRGQENLLNFKKNLDFG